MRQRPCVPRALGGREPDGERGARASGVEAGLATVEAARTFAAFDWAFDSLRVLIEPQEPEIDRAEATVRGIECVLDESGIDLPRLLHGTGATTWALIRIADARGYDTRVGFEDTLVLPDGTLAASNGELVREASRLGAAVRAGLACRVRALKP